MASMTYCLHRAQRISSHRMHCEIAVLLLISAFLAYASGIQNAAKTQLGDITQNEGGAKFGGAEYTELTERPPPAFNYDNELSITPPSLTSGDITNSFRPSQQIFDFTLSDAATPATITTSLQNRPQQSYLNGVFNSPLPTSTTPNYIQSPFEPQQQQQHQQIVSATKRYGEAVSFHSFGNSASETKPILSYHDPSTNQNYQPPLSASKRVQFQDNDNDVIYQQQGSSSPGSSYTVQSTLLVGNGPNRVDDNGYHRLSAPNNEYMRPGYVSDEKTTTNYISSNNNNKFKQQFHPQQYHQGQQQQQNINEFPAHVYNSDLSQQLHTARPQRVSYDSHDYPSPIYTQRPTYQQQQQQHQQQQHQQHQYQQHSAYFETPQRQDIGFSSISQPTEYLDTGAPSSTLPSRYSNYANNFGNYLLSDTNHQKQQQEQYAVNYKPSNYHPSHPNQVHLSPRPRPSPAPAPLRPPYQPHQQQEQQQFQQRPPYSGIVYHPSAQRPSNYYDYQFGEIPPPRRPTPPPPPYPNYGPQRPPTASSASGLASLSSLFTTTQQYAPQFTNLLIDVLTGGADSGSTSTSNRPSQQQHQQQRPINMQFIRALENIARNDHLQCVPKVLCQTIASQTQRGQLPNFITSPAITKFLADLPAASPALIYGRAALLGISGGEGICAKTYDKCPKNEVEILHYLNNHRGGFFKFFSEPEPQQPSTSSSTAGSGNYNGGSGGGGNEGGSADSSSLLSILSLLTGNPAPTRRPTATTTTTTQRPLSTLGVAGGIGNIFVEVLSNYLGGVEHQRRRRRRVRRYTADTIEPETEKETEMASAHKILHDEDFHDDEDGDDMEIKQFDDNDADNDDDDDDDEVEARILHRDEARIADYPTFFPDDEHTEGIEKAINTFNAGTKQKKLIFPNGNEENDQEAHHTRHGKKLHNDYEGVQYNGVESSHGHRIVFPDHYEEHIRKGRILNKPTYAASFSEYVHADDDDRFVLSNNRRRPNNRNYQSTTNNYDQSQSGNHQYSSITNNNSFRPTPISTISSSYTDSNNHSKFNYYSNKNKYNYPNNNYVSNNRYSNNYERYKTPTLTTTTRRPRLEDDPNVYITNGHGVTEFYITPDGRKIFL